MKTKTGKGGVVSVAPKAGSAQEPSPVAGDFDGDVPSVPGAARSVAGLPSSNRGSELFTADPGVGARVQAQVAAALKRADASTAETFEV